MHEERVFVSDRRSEWTRRQMPPLTQSARSDLLDVDLRRRQMGSGSDGILFDFERDMGAIRERRFR